MKPTPRSNVEGLVAQAKSLGPDGSSAPLPPMDGFPDIPQWHHFEHSLWSIGEQIRQALNSQPKLRGDHSLYAEFLAIVQNRHAMRGRQSFVFCLPIGPVSRGRPTSHLSCLIPTLTATSSPHSTRCGLPVSQRPSRLSFL